MDSSGERSSTGREFQVLGPLTANVRSRDPPDFPCQTRSKLAAERNCERPATEDARICSHQPDMVVPDLRPCRLL